MTKKDYLRAVNVIHSVLLPKERKLLIESFVDFFQGDNPRFDEDRFRKACQNES
jgi:hypothetical protein